MKRGWFLLGALACLFVVNTASAAIISGGSHDLAPGGIYTIPITTSSDKEGESVWGLDLYLEIVEGEPGVPTILDIDLVGEGTLFHGNNTGQHVLERPTLWLLPALITVPGDDEIPLGDETVLAWLQIDTRDARPGRYELRLKNVMDDEVFTSDFTSLKTGGHMGATVYDGVLNVVPEPSSIILGGVGGLVLWGFGRIRKRQN